MSAHSAQTRTFGKISVTIFSQCKKRTGSASIAFPLNKTKRSSHVAAETSQNFCVSPKKNSNKEKKKRSTVLADMMIHLYTENIILDMFSLFKMPKRRTFGDFLTSSEDKLFSLKRRTYPPKRGRMITPYRYLCNPSFICHYNNITVNVQ